MTNIKNKKYCSDICKYKCTHTNIVVTNVVTKLKKIVKSVDICQYRVYTNNCGKEIPQKTTKNTLKIKYWRYIYYV
ncbi:hypothetical protein UT300009_30660 [Paraclostridium bifermentans]